MKFNRVARLLGTDALERLGNSRVIIFGIGGVGGWCAEALIRSGVGHLTVVDADCVAESNINRQPMAFTSTVGQRKTDALRRILLDINPDADIITIDARYTSATATDFDLGSYDYVIDAIDSLADKAALILHAASTPSIRFYSSMGAALKADPTRIEVAEFWKIKGCPLAAALRRRFKRSGIMPRRKFKCVFSPELMTNQQSAEDDTSGAMNYNHAVTNGALVTVTATFGLTLASLVINDAMKQRP